MSTTGWVTRDSVHEVIVDTSEQPIQVRGREPKRYRTVEEKRRIVEEALQAGASVARVARAHGVNANQGFAWRRLYRQGRLERRTNETRALLPARLVDSRPEASQPTATPVRRTPSGVIHMEVPKGQLRITGCVDA